jgi:hypothetical protein
MFNAIGLTKDDVGVVWVADYKSKIVHEGVSTVPRELPNEFHCDGKCIETVLNIFNLVGRFNGFLLGSRPLAPLPGVGLGDQAVRRWSRLKVYETLRKQ